MGAARVILKEQAARIYAVVCCMPSVRMAAAAAAKNIERVAYQPEHARPRRQGAAPAALRQVAQARQDLQWKAQGQQPQQGGERLIFTVHNQIVAVV